MQAGDTFRLHGVADRHTWVIVSDPGQNPAQVYCVAFASHDVSEDQICIILPHGLGIISNTSFIGYFDVMIASVAALEVGIKKGLIQQRTPVSPGLLRKIRDGFNTTRDTKFEYVKFLLDQGVIQ